MDMKSEARKIFLTGVGTAALTCEKAGDVINKLIEKGKLSIDEGKELSEQLKRNIEDKGEGAKESIKTKISDMTPLTKESLKELLDENNYCTKADLLEIKTRLDRIEEKLGLIKSEEVIVEASDNDVE